MRKSERPNYYLPNRPGERPKVVAPVEISREKTNEIFLSKYRFISVELLENNFERNNTKIALILESWGDNDYQYMKFMCLYDRNSRV